MYTLIHNMMRLTILCTRRQYDAEIIPFENTKINIIANIIDTINDTSMAAKVDFFFFYFAILVILLLST